jgi:hypothetical protein
MYVPFIPFHALEYERRFFPLAGLIHQGWTNKAGLISTYKQFLRFRHPASIAVGILMAGAT